MACVISDPLHSCHCHEADWGCADPDWVAELDPEVIERSEILAWQVLRALTAYQIGDCPITVRPCARDCLPSTRTWIEATATAYAGSPTYFVRPRSSLLNPQLDTAGNWVNTFCGCTTPCSCSYVPEVILPGPVGRIDEVIVDGVILDSHTYRVDNGNRLVRTDGQDWPRCQDMLADCGEPGSFCVTYVRGQAPDQLAAWMAGVLAAEFARACTGGNCRLPSGVTQVARQGVTYQIGSEAFTDGITGIREVDYYVMTINPNHLKAPPQVYSPDAPAPRVTTWQAGVS